MRLIASLLLFVSLLGVFDRKLWRANHGFCLSIIEAPLPQLSEIHPQLTFPQEIFTQPFHYLGRGAQSFVFESKDRKTVLKFYRFPSHLRRFPWTHHPLGYLFSSNRQKIKAYNIKKLQLSFHSFALAENPLSTETGVLYVHLRPTSTLCQKVHLIDHLGSHYHIPLDSIAFVVQKKGTPFLSAFQEASYEKQKTMLASLIQLIVNRCQHRITDLDNMDNDNYGWSGSEAIHLDIGRFQEKTDLQTKDEILRVTHPLIDYLAANSPELHDFYLKRIDSSILENHER